MKNLTAVGSPERVVHALEEALDNIRAAMGFEVTHYLVLPSDVEELVQAVERQGGAALEALQRLRERYRNGPTPDPARPLSGAAERALIVTYLRSLFLHHPKVSGEQAAVGIEEGRHLPKPPQAGA